MSWQPIETAPRDGTSILLLATRHSRAFPEPEIIVGRHARGWWAGKDVLTFVTHWMPLPETPGE